MIVMTDHVKTLTVGSALVRYRVLGSGPALVLVHGTGPGAVIWDVLLDRLAGRYTLILPDLSGGDAVADDGGPLTVEGLAAQVAAVIEDAGLAEADVVGHSLGASVALTLAAVRPELVRRLVSVAGWAGHDDAYVRYTMEQYLSLTGQPEAFARHGMLTAFSPRYLNSLGPAVENLSRFLMPNRERVRQLELVRGLSILDLLPRVTAPALVVGCTRDMAIPAENARWIHEAIPGSVHAEIDCGHVVRVEAPAELVALIDGFLA